MDHIIISINGTVVHESTRDTIHAIVVDGTTVYNPEFVLPPRTDNPFVAWKAANIDIWTVMTGAYLNRQLNEADWVLAIAAGYTRPEALQPNTNPGLTPDGFDHYRTTMVYPDDLGKVFKASPGHTHYTLTVPDGATVAFKMVLDIDQADKQASLSVDGGDSFDVSGATDRVAVVSAGPHTFDVNCNHEWSVQIR